jgi:hypothetical protein
MTEKDLRITQLPVRTSSLVALKLLTIANGPKLLFMVTALVAQE